MYVTVRNPTFYISCAPYIYITVTHNGICIILHILRTSIYSAKGRPGSRTTKLDSGAQKRLIGPPSKASSHASKPEHDWLMPLSYHRPARRRARELGPQASVRRPWGLSRNGQFCTVFRIFTLRVEIFRIFFCSRLPMTPMNHETFHANRSVRF